MNRLEEIRKMAEEKAKEYNSEEMIPFPFSKITNKFSNLEIRFSKEMPDKYSGMIIFFEEKDLFAVLINENKPVNRQYLTIAHELGHYFLHQENIKREPILDYVNVLDQGKGRVLYNEGDEINNINDKLETEANNFAISLLMPEDSVRMVWKKIKDVDDCAKIFNVPVEAMSIRLSRLGLVD